MSELRVTRADLRPQSRDKDASDITLSDLKGTLTQAVAISDTVTFTHGKVSIELKGPDGGGTIDNQSDQYKPDYLDRKEDGVTGSDDTNRREGTEGTELQHHDTQRAQGTEFNRLEGQQGREAE